MSKNYVLWTAAIIVLLVAGAVIYFSLPLPKGPLPLWGPSPTATSSPAGPFDTTELDRMESQTANELSGLEAELNDFENVDLTQDESGL